jgi:hypothetical protein
MVAKGDPATVVSAPVLGSMVKARTLPGGVSSEAKRKRFWGSTVRYRFVPAGKGDPMTVLRAPLAAALSASILPASPT